MARMADDKQIVPFSNPIFGSLPSASERIAELEAENARLREIIQDVIEQMKAMPKKVIADLTPALIETIDHFRFLPHRDAVAFFHLNPGAGAKQKSKFMEKIRSNFETGARVKGRTWEYEISAIRKIAAALNEAGKQDEHDPTPSQIEAAKLAILAERVRRHSPIHSPPTKKKC